MFPRRRLYRVETLECGQRRSGKAKFTIVVVFENNSPRLLGPAQQFQSPREAERHAKRILPARRDINEFGRGCGSATRSYIEAIGVHRHGKGFGAGCL